MQIPEITKYIEETIEHKMSEANTRAERLGAEAVRGIWEIALQLSQLKETFTKTVEREKLV